MSRSDAKVRHTKLASFDYLKKSTAVQRHNERLSLANLIRVQSENKGKGFLMSCKARFPMIFMDDHDKKESKQPMTDGEVDTYKAGSLADQDGFHICETCGTRKKCRGHIATTPVWCCSCLHQEYIAVSLENGQKSVNIRFWCSSLCHFNTSL